MSGQNWWPKSEGAPPLYATRSNPALYSEGAQVAAIASALGTPLLPWQRYVADVAGERRADGSYEHQVIVVSVPRQSGKTALLRAMGVYRAMMGRSVFYTAQTGKDARARWNDLVKSLRLSPAFAGKVKSGEIKVALRGGSEHVEFPGEAVFQAFAPTVGSLHGYTPPTVCIDEAFAQSAGNGELLVGAIEPAQRTIADKQLWIVSTMGTAESTFFHDWIERARAGADRVALFLWGADEDQDPFDLADIAAFHPAVGYEFREIGAAAGLVTSAASILSASEKMTRAEYVRAYGNRATPTKSDLITSEAFRACIPEVIDPPTDLRLVTLAYDVDEHSAASAIIAVWPGPSGRPAAMIVRREPGSNWVAPAVIELEKTWRPEKIAAAGNGPVLDVTRDLLDAGVDVDQLPERDYAIASSELLTAFRDQALEVADTETRDFEQSVTGLATRASVVDGIALSRRHSAGSPAAGIALAVALHIHRHTSDAVPLVRFAS